MDAAGVASDVVWGSRRMLATIVDLGALHADFAMNSALTKQRRQLRQQRTATSRGQTRNKFRAFAVAILTQCSVVAPGHLKLLEISLVLRLLYHGEVVAAQWNYIHTYIVNR